MKTDMTYKSYVERISSALEYVIQNEVSAGIDRNEEYYLDYGLDILKRLFLMEMGWSRYHVWNQETTEEMTRIWSGIQPRLADFIQENLKKFRHRKMTRDIQSTSAGFVIDEAMKEAGLQYKYTGYTYKAKIAVQVTKDRCITLHIPYSKLNERLPHVIKSLKIIKEEFTLLGDNFTINKS